MTQTEKRTRKVKTLTAPLSLQVFKKTFWQGFIVETHVLFHIAAISKLVHRTAPNLWTRPSVWPHKDASSETVSLTVVTLWAKNPILPWWYVQADRLTGENCTSSTVAAFNQTLSSLCLKLPCQQLVLWTVNGQKKTSIFPLTEAYLWDIRKQKCKQALYTDCIHKQTHLHRLFILIQHINTQHRRAVPNVGSFFEFTTPVKTNSLTAYFNMTHGELNSILFVLLLSLIHKHT